MKERYKIENSLGMFDLLKGIAMLVVVFGHNRSVFPELIFERMSAVNNVDSLQVMSFGYGITFAGRILLALFFCIISSVMPALMIVAGYGFRKRSFAKMLKANSRDFLKPYLFSAAAAVVLNTVFHYAFFRYLPGAMQESAKIFGGMMLGFTHNISFGGITLFANGPIWYLLALFWAITLFNLAANITGEKYMLLISFALSLLGWILSFLKYTPFGISQGLVGVIYIYIGYYLKKSKFFLKEHDIKEVLLWLFAVIIPNIVFGFLGLVTEMAGNVYSLGPISYVENGLLGVVVLYIFLHLNSINGTISGFIRKIGRYSLYVMCVHTVEMIAIPWYKIADYFASYQLVGFFVIYLVRLVIIFLGCYLVIKGTNIFKERISVWKTRKNSL